MRGTRERIERDLQRSPVQRVLYVEGQDELVMLPALLGRAPGEVFVDGVVLADAGGGDVVEELVREARAAGFPGVFGVVDGDGRRPGDLERGPLFVWPAYDLEAVLVRAVWPGRLGAEPDWQDVTAAYVGTVALNRLPVRAALSGLGGLRHEPRTRDEGQAVLAQWWDQVAGREPFAEFAATADAYEAMTHENRLGWLSGKRSLLNRLGAALGPTEAARRSAWSQAAAEAGGDVVVRAWWDRHVRPPVTVDATSG